MLLVVGDGRSSPRLSGTLFAYVILCMMTLLPLVVAPMGKTLASFAARAFSMMNRPVEAIQQSFLRTKASDLDSYLRRRPAVGSGDLARFVKRLFELEA